jgi:hypothetical protein
MFLQSDKKPEEAQMVELPPRPKLEIPKAAEVEYLPEIERQLREILGKPVK